MDLATVSAGGAARNLVRLDEHDVGAALCQMKGGGEPGVSAADDTDIGAARAFERRVVWNIARREPEVRRWEGSRHR